MVEFVSAKIHWSDGGNISNHDKKICIDKFDMHKGTLMDGRQVQFINEKWVI